MNIQVMMLIASPCRLGDADLYIFKGQHGGYGKMQLTVSE